MGFGMSFNMFGIMFTIVFVLVMGMFVVTIVQGISQWNKNNNSRGTNNHKKILNIKVTQDTQAQKWFYAVIRSHMASQVAHW